MLFLVTSIFFFIVRPPFDVLAVWTESVSSGLGRKVAFPKDLLDDILNYSNNQSRSPTSSECTTPENSYTYITTSGSSSNSSSGASLHSSNTSLPYEENTLSSSCSSLSNFSKPGRLHSICEIDHSSNKNSINNSSLSSPDAEQTIITCGPLENRALSASPS